MRLKTENEELKRADKKKQMIEPKGAAGDQYNSAVEATAPALTSALARVRARRTTSQGTVPTSSVVGAARMADGASAQPNTSKASYSSRS